MMKYCDHYLGESCCDGSCPNALDDENLPFERIKCSECWKYKGCVDCIMPYVGWCPAKAIIQLGIRMFRKILEYSNN